MLSEVNDVTDKAETTKMENPDNHFKPESEVGNSSSKGLEQANEEDSPLQSNEQEGNDFGEQQVQNINEMPKFEQSQISFGKRSEIEVEAPKNLEESNKNEAPLAPKDDGNQIDKDNALSDGDAPDESESHHFMTEDEVKQFQEDNAHVFNHEGEEFQLQEGIDRDDFVKSSVEANPEDTEGNRELYDSSHPNEGFQQKEGLDRDDFVSDSVEANPEDVEGNQELFDSSHLEQQPYAEEDTNELEEGEFEDETVSEEAELEDPEIEKPEDDKYQYIEANRITPGRDVNDSHFYDARGIDEHTSKSGDAQKADYEELAQNIPEVKERLEAGESLENLEIDEKVGETAKLYFDDKEMIQVNDNGDGTYQMVGDGNHRLKAAQDLDYEVPVKVLGKEN
jgi:hypothetical protein